MELAHQDAKLMESSRSRERYPDLHGDVPEAKRQTAKHDAYHNVSQSSSIKVTIPIPNAPCIQGIFTYIHLSKMYTRIVQMYAVKSSIHGAYGCMCMILNSQNGSHQVQIWPGGLHRNSFSIGLHSQQSGIHVKNHHFQVSHKFCETCAYLYIYLYLYPHQKNRRLYPICANYIVVYQLHKVEWFRFLSWTLPVRSSCPADPSGWAPKMRCWKQMWWSVRAWIVTIDHARRHDPCRAGTGQRNHGNEVSAVVLVAYH